MTTFTDTILETFHVVSCYTCDVNFGITDGLYRRAVKDRKGVVYCPACGSQSCWTGETEADKERRLRREAENRLSRERATHDQTRAELERTERRRRAAVGQTTKIRNRVAKGVCPCCNRHFDDLRRHMESKHPEWAGEPPAGE